MLKTAGSPTLRNASAGEMNQSIDEGATGHTVHGHRHGRKFDPRIACRVVDIMIGKDAGRRIFGALSSEGVDVAMRHHRVQPPLARSIGARTVQRFVAGS